MTVLARYNKQPNEKRKFEVSYVNWLETGDTISSAGVVSDDAAVTVSGVVIDPVTSDKISFFVEGGVDGTDYKLTVTATTADTRVKEDEVIFKVREV